MVRSACHCGIVRLTVEPAPKRVLDCNCSICRRYGALWAYPNDPRTGRPLFQTVVVQGANRLEGYVWGDKWSAVWRCRACGCVMFGTPRSERERILSVNARMFAGFDPASVSIQRIDNAHTGWFWSRPDAAILP